MPVNTANDMIREALLAIRVIQENEGVPAGAAADCLNSLNMMIDSWNTEGLMTFCDQVQQLAYPAQVPAAGTAYQLTVGVGGQFNCQRPDSLIRTWVLQAGAQGNILPQWLVTQGEFDAIRQKPSSGSYPTYVWYDPQSPLGILNLWPNPNQAPGGYIQVIRFRTFLAAFSALTSSVTGLPPGYTEAIVMNLAGRIAPKFGRSALEALQSLIDQETGMPLAGVLKGRLKAINSVNKAALLRNDIPQSRAGMAANILTNSINPPGD